MAFDAFLKLDGIKGESADHKHKGEIDIMSFSFGAQQTGISHSGGGGGAGKVQVSDFHFVKKVDSSSPLLFINCATGAHIKEGNFVVRKAGGEQLEYLKIKLTDILVSSYKPEGSINGAAHQVREAATSPRDLNGITGNLNGDEVPMESITLNFAKIEYNYQPQGADGKAQGGPIMAGWDVKGNKKV